MAISRTSPAPSISGHHKRFQPPSPLVFPPRNIPTSITQQSQSLQTSILGEPPLSFATATNRFPEINEDGFQPFLTRNSKRRLRQGPTTCSFRIEAKIFTLNLKQSNRRPSFQLSEQRPALTRSITILAAAMAWLKTTVDNCVHHRRISAPLWYYFGKPTLEAKVSANSRGRYIGITDFITEIRPSTVCIPHGRNAAGWITFLSYLPAQPQLQHPNSIATMRTVLARLERHTIS